MQKTYPYLLFLFMMFSAGAASAAVTVSSLSVYNGPPGTAVTITGTGFDATATNNAVYFGAAKAVVSAATTTTLTVSVPAGASYGQVSVANIVTRLIAFSTLPFEPTYTGRSGISASDIEAPVNFNTGGNPMASVSADFDGDGLEDIAVVNSTSNSLSIFQNKASGSISANSFNRTDVALPYSPVAITAADLNSDGKIDLAIVYQNGNTMSAFPNQSTGPGIIAFTSRGDFPCNGNATAIAAADVQNDGKIDLITANFSQNTFSVYRNQIGATGNAVSFVARTDFPTGKGPSALAVADFDGDGKPEIVTGNFLDNSISIFKNNITTAGVYSYSFAAKSDLLVGGRVTAVFSSFIDNDAHPDLVVALHNPTASVNKITVLRNILTATGPVTNTSFTAAVDLVTGSEPAAVGIGDIDGDGNPDIVAADYNAQSVSVFRNTSSGTTISSSTISVKTDFPTGNAPHGLIVNDLDGDGRPEIVVPNDLDNSISVLHNYNASAMPGPVFAESTASASLGSFVNSDIYDAEWEQDPVPGYTVAPVSGANITGGTNKGRFVYFSTIGSVSPMSRVKGNVTFTASGTGTIEIRIIPTWNPALVEASKTFTLSSTPTDFGWDFGTIYPQLEYYLAVIVPSGTTAQFKKNMSLSLQQGNMNGNFIRYRADATSLIGNTETGWYGWNDQANVARKKYLQHSAYSRMRFSTNATQILLEYVRDFYDGRVSNLFPAYQVINGTDWASNGAIVPGLHAIDSAIRVTPGKTYTISGLHTYYPPTYVWFKNSTPLSTPAAMTNISPGTAANPVYSVTAPTGATNLAIMVQKISDPNNYSSPVNDTYLVYTNCMVQEGAVGTVTPYDGTIPSSTFIAYSGHTPARISGPAIFINGKLYNYYQVEGSDQPKIVQYLSDVLPPGTKTVEVMMPGQGKYGSFDPAVRRSGTYLRAVYFPASTTTESPSSTVTSGTALFIHDSILSGFNIGGNAQNNVWMMKIQRDSTYGFTGDIFSEGYASRILHTDTQTPAQLEAFAQKLNNFHVSRYWFQIGVNDYGFATPLPNFYTEYKTLVDRLKALGTTSTKVYIQSTGPEIFEGPNSETYTDDGLSTTGPVANDFRDVQRAIANNRSFCEYVDFENLFVKTPVNLSDGIHPTDQGNIAYANGIKNNSTLLGKSLPGSSLAFYSRDNSYTLKTLTRNLNGIAVITAKGGKLPYTFALASGSMPAGLTLNPDGVISGTATVNGTFSLAVKVTDATPTTVTRNYSLTINPSPTVIVAPLNLRGATTGTSWSKSFKGMGGFAKYTLSASGLPSGFTFDPVTATVAGTPTAGFSFTVTATDHYGFSGNKTYTVPVGSGTPAALSAIFTTTTTLSGNNVLVTGKLNDYYNETLIMGVGAIVTQGGTNTFYQGDFVVVNGGSISSPAVNIAQVDLSKGAVSSVKLVVYTSTSSLTQVNTNDVANLTFDANPVTNFP